MSTHFWINLKLKLISFASLALTIVVFNSVLTSSLLAQSNSSNTANTRQTIGDVLRSIKSDLQKLSQTLKRDSTRSNNTNNPQIQALTRTVANISLSVNNLDQDIRNLQGKMDEMSNKLDQIKANILALQALNSSSGSSFLDSSDSSNSQPTPAAIPKPTASQPKDPLVKAELFIRSNNYEEARSVILPVIQNSPLPKSAEARYILGEILYHQGSYKASASSLILALGQLDESSRKDSGLLYLARSLEKLKQVDQACEVYDELLSIDEISVENTQKQDIQSEKQALCS